MELAPGVGDALAVAAGLTFGLGVGLEKLCPGELTGDELPVGTDACSPQAASDRVATNARAASIRLPG